MSDERSAEETTKHTGGCHCGAIRFEVGLPPKPKGSRCNCSICTKIAPTGFILKPAAFKLVAPASEEGLSRYVWGGRVSTRFFCKDCGVHCYGRGHLDVLGGDFVSVNLNCVDGIDPSTLEIDHWDGRHDNWQAGPKGAPWPITR